ncbi:MAG: thiamine pyrophosphate-dependent enzyme, partial [Acidimicrobiia bacterium]
DLTLLVHNNKVYGLTKGQASPTSDLQMVTRGQPYGVIAEPFNPLAVALALKAGFIARGFAGNKEHLSMLIQEGIRHRGFSLIDILQPCVTHPLAGLLAVQALVAWMWWMGVQQERWRPPSPRLLTVALGFTAGLLMAVWALRWAAGTLPPV